MNERELKWLEYQKNFYTTNKAAVVIIEKGGLFLGVSREYDYEDFGFPGGKLEGDETYERAAIREVHEETRLSISNLIPIYEALSFDNHYVITFVCSYIGIPESRTSEGVVKWVTREEICSGTFSEYNTQAFAAYDKLNGK